MVDWINISQNSGSGNATITVTATSYSQLLERSTALTVRTATKSAVVGITQRYNSSFTVSPATISAIPYSGASYSITITANGNWSATTIPAWCSLSANGGASGTSIITLTVSSNSGSARNDTLVFTCNGLSRSVEVSQAADESEITPITLYPRIINIPSSGGSQEISIIYDGWWSLSFDGGVWGELSPYSDDPQHASGHGNTTLTLTAGPNTGDARTAEIWACDDDCMSGSVVQAGYYVQESGSISPSSLSLPFYENSTTVYVTSNVAWALSTNMNYVSLSPSSGMSGTSIPVTVTVGVNSSSSSRNGEIFLQNSNNLSLLDTASLTQASNEQLQFSVSNNHIWADSSGGTYYIPYSSNVPIFIDTETDNYGGNWTFTIESNRIVATCPARGQGFGPCAESVCEVIFNIAPICTRAFGVYQRLGNVYLSQDPSCIARCSGTNVYNITTTSSPTELMQIDPAFLRWVKIDGTNVPISSLICDEGPYSINDAATCPGSPSISSTAVYPKVKYTFGSTGNHTVSFACVKAPQYQPRLDNGVYVNDIPLVSMEYTTGSVQVLPSLYNDLLYGPSNPRQSIGIQSLSSVTVTTLDNSSNCGDCRIYLYTHFDGANYNYTYNMHIPWDTGNVYYDTFENTNATDLWFDGYGAPTWRGEDQDHQKFIGLAPIGTAHAISGSDYRGIASHLPSGWTLVYDA